MTSTVLFSVLTLVRVLKIFSEQAFYPPLISPPTHSSKIGDKMSDPRFVWIVKEKAIMLQKWFLYKSILIGYIPNVKYF